MKLFSSNPSPFCAKVHMAAHLLGLPVDVVVVNTAEDPAELIAANPLGKIPTLVLDDGTAMFDSRAIMLELDRMSGGKLYPHASGERRAAELLEAAADGLCDTLLAQAYERRFRPADKVYSPWLDRQAMKSRRALDWLEAEVMPLADGLHGGQLALAAALGYLDLRFADTNWRHGRPRLGAFDMHFAELHPALAALKPSA